MNVLLLTTLLLSLELPASQAQSQSVSSPDNAQGMECPRWTRDKPFLAVTAVTGLSVVSDVESTQRFRARILGQGLQPGEANPLARPFVANRGRQYAVWSATAAGASWLGWKMKNSQRRWVRRLWPLPQLALAAVNFTAAGSNLRGMRRFETRRR